jgi:hypothetical protein
MYLIRILAGPSVVMRDGRGKKDPMKAVSQDRFTLFSNLPAGLTVHGGPGVEVRTVATEAEAKQVEQSMAKQLEAETAARLEYAARVKARIEAMKKSAADAAAVRVAQVAVPKPAERAKFSHQTSKTSSEKPSTKRE